MLLLPGRPWTAQSISSPAHHLDPDFYDRFFEPGAYLRTHAEHMRRWHGGWPT